MPDSVHAALVVRGLMEAHLSRPPYQQNDYVGWISRAKREETQLKRLAQMLDELASGDRYMNMAYRSASAGAGGCPPATAPAAPRGGKE